MTILFLTVEQGDVPLPILINQWDKNAAQS
jgi:hypothetical protein